jgi:hypothetical protein
MKIKLYIWSKTIHRLFLFTTTLFILLMSVTGIIMKYSFFSGLRFLDPVLIRNLHNEFSIYFVVSVSVMMLTGLYMYIFPHLKR